MSSTRKHPKSVPHEETPQSVQAPAGAQAISNQAGVSSGSMGGLLLRLSWMAWGNLVLLFFAGAILHMPTWSLSWLDLGYWLTVMGLGAARYFDVARFHGMTINAEPATIGHVRRYVATLAVIALALWFGTHSIEA